MNRLQDIQVIEGRKKNQIRLATKGNYSDVIFCEYPSDLLMQRLLDGDNIIVYGKVTGLKKYTAIFGNKITIPELLL